MLINILKNDGTSVARSITLENNLHGLRITSLILESPAELVELTSEAGKSWLLRIASAFVIQSNNE